MDGKMSGDATEDRQGLKVVEINGTSCHQV